MGVLCQIRKQKKIEGVPATVEDVLSYQSVTPNAYNEGNLCRGKVEKGNLRQGKVENRQTFVLEQAQLSLLNR